MIIEPTKDEIRNGWDAEALAKYHKEREKAAHEIVFKERKTKPAAQARYRPHRWRE